LSTINAVSAVVAAVSRAVGPLPGEHGRAADRPHQLCDKCGVYPDGKRSVRGNFDEALQQTSEYFVFAAGPRISLGQRAQEKDKCRAEIGRVVCYCARRIYASDD
jgi:hypothetical protein